MKLILIESVEHLGLPGDVVTVKPGYARNFLLPKRLALKATDGNVAELAHQQAIAEQRRKKAVQDLGEKAQRLRDAALEFTERVSEGDRLYGSVSARRIAEALTAKVGFDVPPAWVRLSDPIKEAGSHQVTLRLGPDIDAVVAVEVLADRSEQEAAAAAAAAEASAQPRARAPPPASPRSRPPFPRCRTTASVPPAARPRKTARRSASTPPTG